MGSDLLFSLNTTMPVFLVMVIGYMLGRARVLTKEFCKTADWVVFHLALPCMLFLDIAKIDLSKEFDVSYVLFCAGATVTAILTLWLLAAIFMKDKTIIGEFVQASYRSSAAILGTTYIINMYGDTGMAPLMIIGSVPLFNMFAVVILTFTAPKAGGEAGNEASVDRSGVFTDALIGIAKNPIIHGIVLGMLYHLVPFDLPTIAEKTLSNLGNLTAPLALLSIGATFEGAAAIRRIRPTLLASFIKLFVLVGIFIPIAAWFGYRGAKLVALLIMLGSPTTATSYIMAKNMGHEGVVSSGSIAATTLLSSFSLTLWVFILKSMELI
ncbi:MAG: AEC family transporter [Lachnospiraceae bacterium]|nr:AEC family transporter [Lachnospiraceae bacterium]